MTMKELMISGSREELVSFCAELAATMDNNDSISIRPNYANDPEISLRLEVADDGEQISGLLYDLTEEES